MEKYVVELQAILAKYRSLGISQQIDYDKFYLFEKKSRCYHSSLSCFKNISKILRLR